MYEDETMDRIVQVGAGVPMALLTCALALACFGVAHSPWRAIQHADPADRMRHVPHAPPAMRMPVGQAFAEVDACKDELLRCAAVGEAQQAQQGVAGAAGASAAAAAAAAAAGDGSELGGELGGKPSFSLFETAQESLVGFGGEPGASPAAAATGSKAPSGEQAAEDHSPDVGARQALVLRVLRHPPGSVADACALRCIVCQHIVLHCNAACPCCVSPAGHQSRAASVGCPEWITTVRSAFIMGLLVRLQHLLLLLHCCCSLWYRC